MRKPLSHPDQLALRFGKESEIERIIEARVAIRAEADAIRWRFRLILIETGMLTLVVLIAGWLIGQPLGGIFRSAMLVCAGCLASGLTLVGLSGGVSLGLSRVRRWKRDRDNLRRWAGRS